MTGTPYFLTLTLLTLIWRFFSMYPSYGKKPKTGSVASAASGIHWRADTKLMPPSRGQKRDWR
jgi:hypothetical protein